MRKQKNVVVSTDAKETNEVIAIAIVNDAPANEVPATVDAPKAEKVPALSEAEKTAIKGRKAAKIVETCDLTEKVIALFIKEGFTLYPSRKNAAGEKQKAIAKALAGIDKLTYKEGETTVQYFFYSNPLPNTTLNEIFEGAEKVPAMQKFSTGGGRFNPFMRVPTEKVPVLIAASISTPYALQLFADVENEAKKKAAKTEPVTTESNEAF